MIYCGGLDAETSLQAGVGLVYKDVCTLDITYRRGTGFSLNFIILTKTI